MKNSLQYAVAEEIIKEISISPKGKKLILIAMVIQLPLMWLPYVTQIITFIILLIALTQIKVVKKKK